MAADQRHESIALLWLIAADLDPTEQDTRGNRRDESLSLLLADQYAAGRRQCAAAVLAGRSLPAVELLGGTAHVWLFNSCIDPRRHDANGEAVVASLTRLLENENNLGRCEAMGLYDQSQASKRPSGEYEVGTIGHDDPTGSYKILPDGMVEKLLDIAS